MKSERAHLDSRNHFNFRQINWDANFKFLGTQHVFERVLRKKKYCCITIGNPIYGGKIWKLNEFIKQNAIRIGFTYLNEISRGKYHSTMGKMKEEFILIFRNE